MRSQQYHTHQHLGPPVFLLSLQRFLRRLRTKEVQDDPRRLRVVALLLITIATFVWVMCMRINQQDILKNYYLVQTVADQVLPFLVSGHLPTNLNFVSQLCTVFFLVWKQAILTLARWTYLAPSSLANQNAGFASSCLWVLPALSLLFLEVINI